MKKLAKMKKESLFTLMADVHTQIYFIVYLTLKYF